MMLSNLTVLISLGRDGINLFFNRNKVKFPVKPLLELELSLILKSTHAIPAFSKELKIYKNLEKGA